MKRIKTIVAVVTTGLAITIMSPTIRAYATYAHWGTSSVGIFVNPVNADVSESAATSALQAGMDVWNTQGGTPLRLSYSGRVNDTTTGYDSKNVILFRNASSGSTIASTYSWTSGGVLVDSDIVFWDGGFQFFTGSSSCTGGAYIEDIAAHELGHVIGMSHSSDTTATMYAMYNSCSQDLRTLTADDIAGAQTLYGTGTTTPTPTNTAPSVTITSPANGASVSSGASVTFSGSASDTQDGSLTGGLVWFSSIDGQIGTGGSFTRTLTPGAHTITASVNDSGSLTTQKSISVSVSAPVTNTAPSVTISSPANGTNYAAGTSVTFTGSASDTQDGNLTSGIVWRSNIDGQLGTGGSVTRTLTSGTHTITATVSDSGALTSQRTVSVSVTAAAPPQSSGPTLTVKARKVKGVQIADLSWANLTAASVDVHRNGSTVKTIANTGSVTDNIGQKGTGSYSYEVCAAGTSTCSNQVNASF